VLGKGERFLISLAPLLRPDLVRLVFFPPGLDAFDNNLV
jgi:hypothetical protein